MYVSARQIERNIQIYKHERVEDAIKETAQTLLDQLKGCFHLPPVRLDAYDVTIEQLFASGDEGDMENAEKLQYLIDNACEVIEKLEIDQEFNIGTYNDPAYDIAISKDSNQKIKVTTYSNVDDNNFWDEVIEWLD